MATQALTIADPKTKAAWAEYLDACKATSDPWRYDEVEEWAWARLQQALEKMSEKA